MNLVWNLPPNPSDTAKLDIITVYYCPEDHALLLRDDTLKVADRTLCRRHLTPVRDVTHTPVGHAYRQIVAPQPRI